MKEDHMKGHHMKDGHMKDHHMKKHGDHMMGKGRDKVPSDLDLATTKMSKNGMFKVSITSKLNPVAINKMHAWVLTIQKPDGSAVSDAKVDISGGMPQHGHGFPTHPRVTKNLGDGKYLIEGVRFNMGGWWELKATIGAGMGMGKGKGGHTDKVTFNIVLK
jgi:hypothetical protein